MLSEFEHALLKSNDAGICARPKSAAVLLKSVDPRSAKLCRQRVAKHFTAGPQAQHLASGPCPKRRVEPSQRVNGQTLGIWIPLEARVRQPPEAATRADPNRAIGRLQHGARPTDGLGGHDEFEGLVRTSADSRGGCNE